MWYIINRLKKCLAKIFNSYPTNIKVPDYTNGVKWKNTESLCGISTIDTKEGSIFYEVTSTKTDDDNFKLIFTRGNGTTITKDIDQRLYKSEMGDLEHTLGTINKVYYNNPYVFETNSMLYETILVLRIEARLYLDYIDYEDRYGYIYGHETFTIDVNGTKYEVLRVEADGDIIKTWTSYGEIDIVSFENRPLNAIITIPITNRLDGLNIKVETNRFYDWSDFGMLECGVYIEHIESIKRVDTTSHSNKSMVFFYEQGGE